MILSILLHLLFLFFYNSLSTINLFPSAIDELLQEKPEQEKRIEFELVETPDDAKSKKPLVKTNLVSDKNSIARDGFIKKNKTEGNPYSEGNIDVKNLPVVKLEPVQQFENEIEKQNNSKDKLKRDEISDPALTYQKFSRQQILKNAKKTPQIRQDNPNRPLYENKEFNAKDLGGFSFNTYNWNFAPYMLAMKRKVEHNIFPPPAFTQMGLIGGITILRFKVFPNGEVKDLKVLKHTGHESLKETSIQAILNSSRFKPLPADFPESFLEVTASFSYYVSRR